MVFSPAEVHMFWNLKVDLNSFSLIPYGNLRSISDFWSCGPSVLWSDCAGYWCHVPGIDKKKLSLQTFEKHCIESGILQITLTRLNSVTVYSPWILHYSKFILLLFFMFGIFLLCFFLLFKKKQWPNKNIQVQALLIILFSLSRNLYRIAGFNICFLLFYCLFLMSHD